MEKRKIQLALASFLSQLTICMINFSMIYYMKFKYGLTSVEIGFASSIYTVTYFISCLLLQKALVHLKRKNKAIFSLCGMGLSHLLILLSSSTALLYVLLAFYGISMSLLWPNIEAWITEGDDDESLAGSVSLFNFSWSFGAGLSTMAGGFLVEIGASFAVAIAVAVFFLIALFLVFMRQEGGSERQEHGTVGKDESTNLRYLCWIGIFLSYSCYALMINIFPLYAYDRLGFSESLTGNLLLVRGMVTCFSFMLFSRLHFWRFSLKTILSAQIVLGLLFMLFAWSSSTLSYIVCFFLYGIVFALVYELSIFHGASGALNKDVRMVIHEVLINVGQVIGSLLGGFIYQYYSFNSILYVLSAMTFLFVIFESLLFLGFHRQGKTI